MSDLAYNFNGESFEVPAAAQCWRVRRMKQRGAPEVVYGREGVPLTIPIESDLEDLRRNVDAPGRYRLDAADERGRALPDVPAAYVHVASVEPPTEAAVGAPTADRRPAPDSPLTEAMRLNTELAKSVIDRFPEMMHAAAELLRAADGAGLPARAPRQLAEALDDGEDDDREPVPTGSPTVDLLNTLVAQVVPLVVTALASKRPTLAELLDWRKAVPEAPPARLSATASSSADVQPSDVPDAEEPTLDPQTMSHFLAIMQALTPEERALGQALAGELSPGERSAWMSELTALPVADAVARVRELLGDARRARGAA